MKNKKIILHIGAPKTATTLIQNCLKKSSSILLDQEIYICDFLGPTNHKELAYTFLDNNKKDQIQKNLMLDSDEARQISMQKIRKKFFELIDDSRVSKLIISSEDLQSKLDKKAIKNLSKFFDDLCVDVSVIFYIREQAAAINSHYSTSLKSGIKGVRLYPNRVDPRHFVNTRYNYLKSAKQWFKYFPSDFKLLIFDKKEFYSGTIISDFCYHANIPIDILLDAYKDLKNSKFSRNSSLTDCHVKLINLFNYNFRSNYPKNEAKKILNKIQSLDLDSKSYIMPKIFWDEIRNTSRDSNEELRQIFFPARKTLFDLTSEHLDYSDWALLPFHEIDFTEETILLDKILASHTTH